MTDRIEVHVGLFHPVEHALIAHWLNAEPPDAAKDIDISAAAAPLDNEAAAAWLAESSPRAHVYLEHSLRGTLGENAIDNAVARRAARVIGRHGHRDATSS